MKEFLEISKAVIKHVPNPPHRIPAHSTSTSRRMQALACVLLLLARLAYHVNGLDCVDTLDPDYRGPDKDIPYCELCNPIYGYDRSKYGYVIDAYGNRREKCPLATSKHESKWTIPLKSEKDRELVIHLGPKSIGFTPDNVTLTSRTRSTVQIFFSLTDDGVDRREKHINGSFLWSGSGCQDNYWLRWNFRMGMESMDRGTVAASEESSPFSPSAGAVLRDCPIKTTIGGWTDCKLKEAQAQGSDCVETADETGIGFKTRNGWGEGRGTYYVTNTACSSLHYNRTTRDFTSCDRAGWSYPVDLSSHSILSSKVGTTLLVSIAASNMSEDLGDMSRATLEIRDALSMHYKMLQNHRI